MTRCTVMSLDRYNMCIQIASKQILRLFVEGTQKSQRAVSASLIRIADHLKQLQEVEKKIKDMLYELTSTLRSTVTVFAPLIAGVTLAITTLISTILTSMQVQTSPEIITDHSLPVSQVYQGHLSMENIRPEYFVLSSESISLNW